MAWRCGSLSRTLLSSARAPSLRSLPRPRSSLPTPHSPRRAPPHRTLSSLGCTQSMLPLHSAVATSRLTSRITVEARAFAELSQGT